MDNDKAILKKEIETYILEKNAVEERMKEQIVDRSLTACFTGHRPSGLPQNENGKNSLKYLDIVKKLNQLIIESIKSGYTYFICGLAQGIDMLCAELIIKFKQDFPKLILECAIPHLKQCFDYSNEDLSRYLCILKNSDVLTLVSEEYKPGCMMKRNKHMVDKSSLLIGVWNGNKGGTHNTIKYAQKKGIDCKLIYF